MSQGPEDDNEQDPLIVQGFDSPEVNNVLLEEDFALGNYDAIVDEPPDDHYEPFDGLEDLEDIKVD